MQSIPSFTRRSLGALLAAACLIGPTLGQAQTRVQHAKGETTLAATPKSVLVFDIAALDTLQALGVEVKGVPGVKFPPYLARYEGKQYAKIGTLFEPNMEAVHAAKPDLIIIGGRSAAKYADLARIAPTIDLTVDRAKFLDSVYGNTRTLGRIFGKEAQAQTLIDQTQTAIRGLAQIAPSQGKGLILLTTGGKLSAYGPGSRFGVLHDSFGVAPAQAKLDNSNHGQAASFEFVLQTNPDWLFVIDRDAAIGRDGTSAARLLDNELVRNTTAWRKQQVVYLDAARWYTVGSAGIGALQANVEQIRTVFQRAGAQ